MSDIKLDLWRTDVYQEEIDFFNQLFKKYATENINIEELEMENIGTIRLPNAGYVLLMKYKNQFGHLIVDCSNMDEEEQEKITNIREETCKSDWMERQEIIWCISPKYRNQFNDVVNKHIDVDDIDQLGTYFETR
jgi:hypothetical protein